MSSISISELMKLLPPGYIFHPSDVVLIKHYLKPKNRGKVSPECIIPEVDVCKYEPWDLPPIFQSNSVVWTNGQENWFFLCPMDFKCSDSNRTYRATRSGFWKVTSRKDKQIRPRGADNVIGTRKTLVFYERRGRIGIKTNWVIHEYHESETTLPIPNQSAFVIYRLRKIDEGEPQSSGKEILRCLPGYCN